jgi:hypothetical protein
VPLQGQNLITIGFEIPKLILTEVNHQINQKMQEELLQLISKYEGKETKDVCFFDAFLI